jgi:hypothetical protein
MNEGYIVWKGHEAIGGFVSWASRVVLHALGDIGIAIIVAKEGDVDRLLEIFVSMKDVRVTRAQHNSFDLGHFLLYLIIYRWVLVDELEKNERKFGSISRSYILQSSHELIMHPSFFLFLSPTLLPRKQISSTEFVMEQKS